MTTLDEVTTEAMKLPIEERELLLRMLILVEEHPELAKPEHRQEIFRWMEAWEPGGKPGISQPPA